MLLKSHTTLIRFLFILNLTYQKFFFFFNLSFFRVPSSIGNNWGFSFIGVYCYQQKDFAKKEWNQNYFRVYVICNCLKPKKVRPYYSISNYHSDLFYGRYLSMNQSRTLNSILMFNYALHLVLIGFYV